MISEELRKALLQTMREMTKYDTPEYTTDCRDPKANRVFFVPPMRIIFSRTANGEDLCRTLSVSWDPARPFSDNDLLEWKALVEEATGHPVGRCGFAFKDKLRIYCFW